MSLQEDSDLILTESDSFDSINDENNIIQDYYQDEIIQNDIQTNSLIKLKNQSNQILQNDCQSQIDKIYEKNDKNLSKDNDQIDEQTQKKYYEDKDFICSFPECRKLFKNQDSLRSHKNKYHVKNVKHRKVKLPQGQYPCPLCHAILKSSFLCKKHFAFEHPQSESWEEKGLVQEQYITQKQIFQHQNIQLKYEKKRDNKQAWKSLQKNGEIKNKLEQQQFDIIDFELNQNELNLILVWLENAERDKSIKSQIKNYISEKFSYDKIQIIFPLQYLKNNNTNQNKFDMYMSILKIAQEKSINQIAQFQRLGFSNTHLAIEIQNLDYTLEDILSKQELNSLDKKHLSIKILQCIINLHDIGFVHNNLTPDNILVSKNFENIKLKGFDYFCRINENEIDGNNLSTIYNHPNQQNMKRGDIAKDFYSYGMIILQMIEDKQHFSDYVKREDFRLALKQQIFYHMNIPEGKIISQCILSKSFQEQRSLKQFINLVELFTFERKIGLRDHLDDQN